MPVSDRPSVATAGGEGSEASHPRGDTQVHVHRDGLEDHLLTAAPAEAQKAPSGATTGGGGLKASNTPKHGQPITDKMAADWLEAAHSLSGTLVLELA